ncbi:MAG: hypothetical protein Q9217_005776 [Psora testacea]
MNKRSNIALLRSTMSIPSRKLVFTTTTLRPCNSIHPLLPLCQHHRTILERFFKRRREQQQPFDPNAPEYKKKLEEGKKKREEEGVAQIGSGRLARSSIFEDEDPMRKHQPKKRQEKVEEAPPKVQDWRKIQPSRRDPNPRTRISWLKKMVMKDVRGRHRLNKTEKLRRTERSHVAKSPLIKTSVKKLGPLARQIAGKPLAEAMVQMRFSKKRAAGDVLKHLQYARNQAIVEKRMSLGLGTALSGAKKKLMEGKEQREETIVVEDKSGKKRVITDRSAMYVDEAWVGRGAYEFGTDYRARGQAYKLYKPHTSISVVLKEEATRIRQAEERAQKRQRKKRWSMGLAAANKHTLRALRPPTLRLPGIGMPLVPSESFWEADIYVPDYIPQAFLAVNESPATVLPPPTKFEIDFASYIASYAGSQFLAAIPEPSLPEYKGVILLQSTASITANTYSRFFEDCLALEAKAHATVLEDYKLYGVNLSLEAGRDIPSFRLKLPGLRDGTPTVNLGETVLLRQLILDRNTNLPRGMDVWLRPGGGRDLGLPAPGFTGYEIRATVCAVDKVDEAIVLKTPGLNLSLPILCNVGFVLPTRLLQTMNWAIRNVAEDLAKDRGCWVRQMLFPQESDGVIQTKLPSAVFNLTWYDKELNYEQKKAVNSVVTRNYGNLPFLLYGPPGSGKTKTVCETVMLLASDPEFRGSILLCAPSNPAADTLTERLRKYLTPKDMFRLNNCSRTFAEVPDTLLSYSCVQNEIFTIPPLKELLRKKVVVSTCRDANILVEARATNRDIASLQRGVSEMLYPFHGSRGKVPCHWLALIVDEAAQATEPETLIPLIVVAPHPTYNSALRPTFVMAGDKHQLSPRTYDKSTTLSVSLFGRLSKGPPYSSHPLARKMRGQRTASQMIRPPFVDLTRNYRSHPAILAVPSALFYSNTLIPEATEVDGLLPWNGWRGSGWPVLFVCNGGMDECEDLRNSGTGWYNMWEIEKALKYASNLVYSGLIRKVSDVCIMSPFPAQVRRLRKKSRDWGLPGLNIGPMEAFQGLESQIVIVCTTRTRRRFLKDDEAKAIGIIDNERKFNVAITRAKEGLIVIGNPWTLSTNVYWDAFLRFCHRNQLWEVETKDDHRMNGMEEQKPNKWTPTKRENHQEELIASGIASLEAALIFRENNQGKETETARRILGVQQNEDPMWQSGLDAEQTVGPPEEDDTLEAVSN